MDTTEKLTCIVCEAPMFEICQDQPSGGTCFTTYGHYGSSVTDHMDGTKTVLFVCDDCVEKGISCGVVKEYRTNNEAP